MGSRTAPLFIFIVLFLMIDIYTYTSMRTIIRGKWFPWVYALISMLGYISMAQLVMTMQRGMFGTRTEMTNLMIGLVFTLFISKLVFSILMFLQDGGRSVVGVFNYIKSKVTDDYPEQYLPDRRKFLTTTATVIAGIPFFTMLYGVTRGKYRYTVEKLTLTFKDLPKSFDGFKLVQISDIHAGSFDSKDSVHNGIKMINDLDADLVCFTGDLVNSQKEEIDPYIDIFAEIRAKHGKYAVLGNHDYYGRYEETPQGEKNYWDDFYKKFDAMGFDLILNERRKVERNGESINIVGVENWGAGRWFPKKGDLDVASIKTKPGEFNILLSHDPSHWEEKVIQHDKHMHLTLSGHTHGFQFGIQVPGYQWSPVKYRYKRWAGLYEEAQRYLYVNRGFGFLGFPGRIGMWPEITLIELRTA
jgi:uncharacterized protein